MPKIVYIDLDLRGIVLELLLNFQAKDREDAKALFKTKQGKDQLKEIRKRAKTFTPGEAEEGAASGRAATNASGLTPEQVRNLGKWEDTGVSYYLIQGVPCPCRLGFVDLDLRCSTTLLGQ